MGDFFAFRRMIAPILIHLIFWVGVLGTLALGVFMLLDKMDLVFDQITAAGMADLSKDLQLWWKHLTENDKNTKYLIGGIFAVGGPLFFRLYCELIMLPFRINGTLTDIRTSLKSQQAGTASTAPAPRRI